MSVSWVQPGVDTPFPEHKLSDLIKLIVGSEDPVPGVQQAIQLADFLILSNHLKQASSLLSAAYNFADKKSNAQLTPNFEYQVFWHTHPTLKRPERIPDMSADHLTSTIWGRYRECTRTGWMLEHWGLAEPEDPSVWHDTSDPIMLAMCTRLLAKTLEPGTYPPTERMRDALAAAQKLYALPELPIVEWLAKKPWLHSSRQYDPANPPRHSSLVYRRLTIELALRLREFQTAADLLGETLTRDGMTHYGSAGHYLVLPGIYDALPLLAEGGKDSSPFFITKDDAEVMTSEILGALELRSTKGRQWELSAEKVGWKELLDRLAAAAWQVYRWEYRKYGVMSADDILYPPATEEEIKEAEEKVGKLPADFKEMVRVANGFKGGHHTFSGGIAGIQKIRPELGDLPLEYFQYDFEQDLRQDGKLSGKMIELEEGVTSDGFRHFIIPAAVWKANVIGREVEPGEYQYFNWTDWLVGVSRWNTVRDYVASCVEEVEGMAERGETGSFDGESVNSGDQGDESGA